MTEPTQTRTWADWQALTRQLLAQEVVQELATAVQRYPAFASEHEGYAVLLEEVDELWEAVRMKQSNPDRPKQIEKEAIQCAAMAMRLVLDCIRKKHFTTTEQP